MVFLSAGSGRAHLGEILQRSNRSVPERDLNQSRAQMAGIPRPLRQLDRHSELAAQSFSPAPQLSVPANQFLNGLFTATRKSRCQRQTTRAEFDCLFSGTRGEADGAGGAPESEPDESMNSRVSWSVDGIDPFVRERPEAAARRAGMSLNDWLNSTLGDFTPPHFRATPDQRPPSQETRDVADIHQRLDAVTRQIEQ